MTDRPNVLIAGGGLAGGLVALALADRRPDLSILVVEREATFGGQHVWSFFDTDLDAACRPLVEPLITRRWTDHEIAFPARQRTIPIGYNSVRSSQLDRVLRERLRADQYRLDFAIASVAANHIIGVNGERIEADVVLNAQGPSAMPGLTLGWQKFVGRTYRFERPHGRIRPMIMDARVEQHDGYRFVYLLPFGDHELLVEDTYYSDSPDLDGDRIGNEVDRIARSIGAYELVEQESGILPVVIDGEVAGLWKDAQAPLLGIRGGFFHPTTGYSLADAAANAECLARQSEFRPNAIHGLLRDRAEQAWRQRRFYQLLNRMLFHAAAPAERYRVLEHFYRLPDATIGRFYAARLTMLDKLRILSGKPPVSIGRALQAVRKQAA